MAKQPRILAGDTAAITGAARGIGRATAEAFLRQGMKVAIGDVDLEAARKTASELGTSAVALPLDVTDRASFTAFLDEAERELGPLDVLVNNAGIYEPVQAVELGIESYRRVLAVNLDAPIFLATRAARGMIDRGYGRIVNITSIHGRFGEELALSYDAAKGGLDQATRTLAIELSRHGVLVNAVAPGFVSTRMSVVDGVNELDSEWFNDVYVRYGKLPMRRYAEPSEIAAQVAWLASSENSYVTGQVLTVDGGVTVTF